MHTIEKLEDAVRTAQSLGFTVRQEWLYGGGGACEIKGKRLLFIDLSLSAVEQLDQVLAAIRAVADVVAPKSADPPASIQLRDAA